MTYHALYEDAAAATYSHLKPVEATPREVLGLVITRYTTPAMETGSRTYFVANRRMRGTMMYRATATPRVTKGLFTKKLIT